MKSQSPSSLPAGMASPHTLQVARWFGLTAVMVDPCGSGGRAELPEEFWPHRGQIVLLTGASGAGKSRLLRGLGEAVRSGKKRAAGFDRCVDMDDLPLPELPVVDCFGQTPLPIVLGWLSRVGLADAWGFLRTPGQLSEGQRWRLKLALAMSEARKGGDEPAEKSAGALSGRGDGTTSCRRQTGDASEGEARTGKAPTGDASMGDASTGNALTGNVSTVKGLRGATTLLLADEFCAVLDRVTAAVVARTLRRAVDGTRGLAAVVATSHDDLIPALRPDRVVRCDFGRLHAE